MSDEHKGLGHTVLGWFIEKDGAGNDAGASSEPLPADATATAEDASATPSPDLLAPITEPGAPPSPPPGTTVPPGPAGKVDFDAVFNAAGIEAEARGQVEKAKALLLSLPADAGAAVKKQIVAASLKAFGIPIERIIEASAQEIQALESYIRAGAAQAESFRTEAERKIAAFQQEIERIRVAAESRTREQQGVVNACNAKKLEVEQILDFFGQEKAAEAARDAAKPEPQNPSN